MFVCLPSLILVSPDFDSASFPSASTLNIVSIWCLKNIKRISFFVQVVERLRKSVFRRQRNRISFFAVEAPFIHRFDLPKYFLGVIKQGDFLNHAGRRFARNLAGGEGSAATRNHRTATASPFSKGMRSGRGARSVRISPRCEGSM